MWQDDGVRHSMVNEVKLILEHFLDIMGDDIATYTEDNYFWHTGCPRNLRTDTYRKHRFWEWCERVAAGTSAGADAKAAPWDVRVRACVFENMFYQ